MGTDRTIEIVFAAFYNTLHELGFDIDEEADDSIWFQDVITGNKYTLRVFKLPN